MKNTNTDTAWEFSKALIINNTKLCKATQTVLRKRNMDKRRHMFSRTHFILLSQSISSLLWKPKISSSYTCFLYHSTTFSENVLVNRQLYVIDFSNMGLITLYTKPKKNIITTGLIQMTRALEWTVSWPWKSAYWLLKHANTTFCTHIAEDPASP
jgi:hypothetical protein